MACRTSDCRAPWMHGILVLARALHVPPPLREHTFGASAQRGIPADSRIGKRPALTAEFRSEIPARSDSFARTRACGSATSALLMSPYACVRGTGSVHPNPARLHTSDTHFRVSRRLVRSTLRFVQSRRSPFRTMGTSATSDHHQRRLSRGCPVLRGTPGQVFGSVTVRHQFPSSSGASK